MNDAVREEHGNNFDGKEEVRHSKRRGSEKELVTLLRNQDEDALRVVMERYHEKLFAVANRICKNLSDSEEVLQDVYMTTLNKIDKFEERSSLSTWLYRITVNAALMKLRSQRYAKATVPIDNLSIAVRDETTNGIDSSEALKGPAESLIAKELYKKVRDSVDTLPDIYRSVFVLRDLKGLSIKETSELLETTPAAIKSRLHRSRLFLREKLEDYYYN